MEIACVMKDLLMVRSDQLLFFFFSFFSKQFLILPLIRGLLTFMRESTSTVTSREAISCSPSRDRSSSLTSVSRLN